MSVLRRAVPEFEVVDLPITSSKAVLVPGHLGGTPAIAKHLVDVAEIWRDHLEREATALAALDGGVPGVEVPRLLRYVPAQPLLIMERVEGDPLARQRYAYGPLPAEAMHDVLRQLNAVAAVRPCPDLPSVDYAARIGRYQAAYGILTRDDSERMLQLVSALGSPHSFSHGDLLPSNCLVCPDCTKSKVRLIDWEFAGTRLPCYDHALLWITVRDDDARDLISRDIRRQGHLAEFTLNCMILLAREVRMHRQLRYEEWAARRLLDLSADQEMLREIMHKQGVGP